MNNKLLHLSTNTTGKDYVCGDLHGCYFDLITALEVLNFDTTKDRLISCGDLIDRGPNSLRCAELIYEDWFYAIKGNHEDMMCQALIYNDTNMFTTWIRNGGNWYYNHAPNELIAIAKDLDQLPLVITVGEGPDRFNIVHAELKKQERDYLGFALVPTSTIPVTDDDIDDWSFNSDDEYDMIWGRSIIGNQNTIYHDADNMSLTFVGHTPLLQPVKKQQQMYIDTGAVFFHVNTNKSEQYQLTLACPATKTLYQYNMMLKTITTIPFSEVKVL